VPWCYIGKRRLEEALSTFDHADQHRGFAPAPVPFTQRTLEQARSMNDRVADVAATVGLDFRLQDAHPANTFPAHRLLHFAATKGVGNELTERLMRGYFSDGVRVGDRDELLGLAVEAGLDETESAEVLDGDAFTTEVRADIRLARAFGATGVPLFVFDRRYAVSGAQETAVFSEVLGTAWSAAQPLTVVGDAGAGCEDEVCAVPGT